MTLSPELLAFLLPLPFLLSMLAAALWPRNTRAPGYIGCVAAIVTLLLVVTVWDAELHEAVTWLHAGGVTLSLSVLIDNVSLLFCAIVAGIGVLIFLYSTGYLETHENHRRYYAALSLFAMAMIGVVTSGNLIQLFFFWELVGLSSYLLIGYWHRKKSASDAARKAFLTIIVGDAFLLCGILLLWHGYGTFDIPALLQAATPTRLTTAAGACIILGAISKSAQFPLHAWLPDAMEGPTPVSAFLHSATMVKAGLFLIVRVLPLLVLAGLSSLLVEIAAVTILLSSLCALAERDIKRVLAYSTMNQLGFILLALGIGATTAGLYHLLNHSVFKALLFLCAGVIIHVAGTQDLTRMKLKLGSAISIYTAIGALSLAGLPILVGFFSKDALFEAVLHTGNVALVVLFVLAAFASAAYIFRWYFLIFTPGGKTGHAAWQLRAPLPVLALLCIGGGVVMPSFYERFGTHTPEISGATAVIAAVSTTLVLAGLLLMYLVYRRGTWAGLAARAGRSTVYLVAQRRFLVGDAQLHLARGVAGIGMLLSRVDRAINDLLDLGTETVREIARLLRHSVSGSPGAYAAGVLFGFVLLALVLRFA